MKGNDTKRHFYPRSPCGERQLLSDSQEEREVFLSTLSLRRATLTIMLYETSSLIFLSTLSLRRATVAPVLAVGRARYFYPRSPCGERHLRSRRFLNMLSFLSTLSLRRATNCCPYLSSFTRISIHALLAESDGRLPINDSIALQFLSTLSLRRATQFIVNVFQLLLISIHALLAESDLGNVAVGLRTLRFLSTLSLRRATVGR